MKKKFNILIKASSVTKYSSIGARRWLTHCSSILFLMVIITKWKNMLLFRMNPIDSLINSLEGICSD